MTDTFTWCDEHGDFWHPGCPRCEACSQHHNGMGVYEWWKSGRAELKIVNPDGSEVDLLADLIAEYEQWLADQGGGA